MKSAKVTNSRYSTSGHGTRYLPDACIVYANSNATKVVDDFFHDNKIYALDFKCRTWTKVGNEGTKLTIDALRDIFGPDVNIKWSRTAGCSCGCSPGYKVKNLKMGSEYRNHDVWVDVEVDTTELVKRLPAYKVKLEAEIAKH